MTGQTPIGTVTFTINGANPVMVSLSSGQAMFSPTFTAAGSQTIAANYSGDTNNPPSSGSLTQVVNPQATATALTASLNPSNG